MPNIPTNIDIDKLAQVAFTSVKKYGQDWLFQSNANHYEIELPQGKLERIHGGGRADVYLLVYRKKRYCLKWFHDSRFITKIRNGLGLSKAHYSLKISKQLQKRNINAPKALAVARPKKFGSTLLVMEMLENYQQLNLMLGEWKKHSPDLSKEPRFIKLAEQFGCFSKNLHLHQVLHRDFSPRNVLVKEENSSYKFGLIDLEDVSFGTKTETNHQHFTERLPRYLEKAEYTLFLEHFRKAYTSGTLKKITW